MYREAGLQVRRRGRKRLTRAERLPLLRPQAASERWSMHFTLDMLADGRAFRTLNIVDDFTHECVANGHFRDECLHEHWFRRVAEAII